jgi:hypothetical protein
MVEMRSIIRRVFFPREFKRRERRAPPINIRGGIALNA